MGERITVPCLPDPAEDQPECCGQPAPFIGYSTPFDAFLRYFYRCSVCGEELKEARKWVNPSNGWRYPLKPQMGIDEWVEAKTAEQAEQGNLFRGPES